MHLSHAASCLCLLTPVLVGGAAGLHAAQVSESSVGRGSVDDVNKPRRRRLVRGGPEPAGLVRGGPAPGGSDGQSSSEPAEGKNDIHADFQRDSAGADWSMNRSSDLGGANDTVFAHAKNPTVPVINFHMDSDPHFEVLLALMNWFKGGDLPYHAGIPVYVQKLLRAARVTGSEVYVNSDFVKSPDRQTLLFGHMKGHNVKLGRHVDPDLTVELTVYARPDYYRRAVQYNWRNNPKWMLIIHNFDETFELAEFESMGNVSTLDTSSLSLADFLDFRSWENTIGLAPTAPRYVIPSYFPHGGQPKRRDGGWYATLCEQGNLVRRNFAPLRRALDMVKSNCKFDLKLAGRGRFPEELAPYKQKTSLLHMDDVAFNDFFEYQCDFLLPLVDETTDPHYFDTKLSSTMARAIGYQLPVLGWHRLQEMYPMVDGMYYHNETEFRDQLEIAMECH